MTDTQAKVGITALGWTVTGIAITLTACRYVVRLRLVGGMKLDDLLHGLALVGAIAYMVIDTYSLRQQYLSRADIPYFERLQITSSILGFVIVIYLVKFAFLVMYRNIFQVSARFMLAWKVVCVLNCLCFLAGFLAYFWLCGSPFQTANPEFCDTPLATVPRTVEIMVVTCLLNSLSSLAVMALPLSMLRQLRIRTSDKVGLVAIFLLAIADMMFDVTRTITTLKVVSNVLEAMATLEAPVAVIASALAALGPLFRYRSRKRLGSYPNSSDPFHTPTCGRGSNSNQRRAQQYEEATTYELGSGEDKEEGRWPAPRIRPEVIAVRGVTASPAFPPALENPQRHGVTTRVSAERIRRKPLPSEPPLPPVPAMQKQTEVRTPIDVSSKYSSVRRTGW